MLEHSGNLLQEGDISGLRADPNVDEEGRYLGGLTAPPRALLQSAAGDTLWGIEFGELDQASVVAYGLVFD